MTAAVAATLSRFKQALSERRDAVDRIMSQVARDGGDELERLQAAGVVPANAPRPGQRLACDSTDIAAYGNPRRRAPETPTPPGATALPRTKAAIAIKAARSSTATKSTRLPTPITAGLYTGDGLGPAKSRRLRRDAAHDGPAAASVAPAGGSAAGAGRIDGAWRNLVVPLMTRWNR